MLAKKVVTPGEAFRVGLDEVWSSGNWVGDKMEQINVVIEIEQPQQRSIYHDDIVDYLNKFHDPADDGTPHFEVVQNWTFPDEVSTGLTGKPRASEDSGEYYEKLCDSEKGNQLSSMVEKIEKWGRNNRTVAQVFQVKNDLNAMFPPCMMDCQAFYRNEKVHLTAHFRSHTLCKSYYGDVISLTKLQEWLADQVDADVGVLTIHSGSLHVRKKNGEHELAEKMYEEIV